METIDLMNQLFRIMTLLKKIDSDFTVILSGGTLDHYQECVTASEAYREYISIVPDNMDVFLLHVKTLLSEKKYGEVRSALADTVSTIWETCEKNEVALDDYFSQSMQRADKQLERDFINREIADQKRKIEEKEKECELFHQALKHYNLIDFWTDDFPKTLDKIKDDYGREALRPYVDDLQEYLGHRVDLSELQTLYDAAKSEKEEMKVVLQSLKDRLKDKWVSLLSAQESDLAKKLRASLIPTLETLQIRRASESVIKESRQGKKAHKGRPRNNPVKTLEETIKDKDLAVRVIALLRERNDKTGLDATFVCDLYHALDGHRIIRNLATFSDLVRDKFNLKDYWGGTNAYTDEDPERQQRIRKTLGIK